MTAKFIYFFNKFVSKFVFAYGPEGIAVSVGLPACGDAGADVLYTDSKIYENSPFMEKSGGISS